MSDIRPHEVLSLLVLLAFVNLNVWLLWRRGTSEADPPEAPVLELLLGAFLYASNEILHYLKRPSIAQE